MKKIKNLKRQSSALNCTVVIEKLGSSGWYCFENIPQETNYVKVHMIRCETDSKALDLAMRINQSNKYIIRDVSK